MLTFKEKKIKNIAISSIIITSIYHALVYATELKHYALEIVGCLGLLSWFINKRAAEAVRSQDVLILALFTLLGISTLPVGVIVIATFCVRRLTKHNGIKKSEILGVLLFLIFAASYYFLVKQLTVFQLSNYPGPYAYRGVLVSVKLFLKALHELGFRRIGGLIVILISSTLLVLLPRRSKKTQRLIAISIVLALSFIVLTGIGLYPARSTRHIIWAVSVTWLLLYALMNELARNSQSLDGNLESSSRLVNTEEQVRAAIDRRPVYLASLTLAFLMLLSSASNIAQASLGKPSKYNEEAVQYIANSKVMVVGLYAGAQPVIDYYSRFYPEFKNINFFGLVRSESTNALGADNYKEEKIYQDAKRPGAYARFWQKNTDWMNAAESVLKEAPRDKEFLIFGSHTGWNDVGKILGKAISESSCNLLETRDYGGAVVHRVYCG
jgi:hypothetical protein